MPRLSGRALGAVLAGLLCAAAEPARAGWERTPAGCVFEYDARSPGRGAGAVINGALYPIRGFLGGVFFSATACAPKARCAPTIPLWIAGSTLASLPEAVSWIVRGGLDTASGGVFALSPPAATRTDFDPVVPFLHRGNPDGRCP